MSFALFSASNTEVVRRSMGSLRPAPLNTKKAQRYTPKAKDKYEITDPKTEPVYEPINKQFSPLELGP